MSKVQSPKSADGTTSATAERSASEEPRREQAHLSQPDVGRWTLDIGLRRDFGLAVNDLRKAFTSPNGERLEVLRGVSFAATPGETVAVIGASGAGKSTLLHLLGGVESAEHGSIRLGTFELEKARAAALARYRNRQVGFVFQFHHLLPDLTAAENVCLPLLLARQNHRQATRVAVEALDRLGLADRSSHRVTELSGGEQQRVAVCRALITQPLLVLADEPTGNLDSIAGETVANDLISYAAARPAIVIIATHNENLAARCNRALLLERGRLVTA